MLLGCHVPPGSVKLPPLSVLCLQELVKREKKKYCHTFLEILCKRHEAWSDGPFQLVQGQPRTTFCVPVQMGISGQLPKAAPWPVGTTERPIQKDTTTQMGKVEGVMGVCGLLWCSSYPYLGSFWEGPSWGQSFLHHLITVMMCLPQWCQTLEDSGLSHVPTLPSLASLRFFHWNEFICDNGLHPTFHSGKSQSNFFKNKK